MNTFHGYGHNRLCQVKEHGLYKKGFGIEDLETCERFFSSSNNVGGVVRHASHFHYTQSIDIFMKAWDEEKYAEISAYPHDAHTACMLIMINRQVPAQQRRPSVAHHCAIRADRQEVQRRDRANGQ